MCLGPLEEVQFLRHVTCSWSSVTGSGRLSGRRSFPLAGHRESWSNKCVPVQLKGRTTEVKI